MQVHKYDVVIVGAGGAGMRAAIEPAASSHRYDQRPTRSHTGAAQGGVTIWLTLRGRLVARGAKSGWRPGRQDAAEIMAKGSY